MKPFPIWCNMCAKQNECHIADTIPKCYEPKQTEPQSNNLKEAKDLLIEWKHKHDEVFGRAEQTEFVFTILDTDYDDNRNGYAIMIGDNTEQTEPQIYVINPQEPTNDDKCFECDDFFTCDDQCDENASADRPQGEWKPKNHHTDYCSNCGFEETQWRTADYNFCPSCGARMKGADDEH